MDKEITKATTYVRSEWGLVAAVFFRNGFNDYVRGIAEDRSRTIDEIMVKLFDLDIFTPVEEECVEVADRFFCQGESMEEIARVLGLSLRTVKQKRGVGLSIIRRSIGIEESVKKRDHSFLYTRYREFLEGVSW